MPPPPFHSGGTNIVVSSDGKEWANISFQTTANQPVEIAFVIPVEDCGETAASVAQCNTTNLANTILKQVPSGSAGPDLLRQLHRTAWESYWNVMQVRATC